MDTTIEMEMPFDIRNIHKNDFKENGGKTKTTLNKNLRAKHKISFIYIHMENVISPILELIYKSLLHFRRIQSGHEANRKTL